MPKDDAFTQLNHLIYEHLQQKKDVSFRVDDYTIECTFSQSPYRLRVILDVLAHGTLPEKNAKIMAILAHNARVLGVFDTIVGYNKKNHQLFLQQSFAKIMHQDMLAILEKALQHADVLLQKVVTDDA